MIVQNLNDFSSETLYNIRMLDFSQAFKHNKEYHFSQEHSCIPRIPKEISM